MIATPSGWKAYGLDELGFVGRGRSRHRPRNDPALYGGPYPFVQTGDIKATELRLRTFRQTYNKTGLAQSKMWEPGTLCITIAANIAETAILAIRACFPDSVIGFVADPRKADAVFIKYYVDFIKLQMQQVSHGTTQDNLSLDKLLKIRFVVPEGHHQRRISSILSAYDDLIENNLRRIKILEEMAQALYHEWFVKFRFPGHEKVRMLNSPLGKIPEGWEVVPLANIAAVNRRSIIRGNTPERIKYVDIASVSPGRISKIEEVDFADAPSRARRIVIHGDTIWSAVRPNRRSFALVLNPAPDLIVSTGFAVLSATAVPYTFLHQAVTTDVFVGYLTNHATGAAYPAVNASDFEQAQLLRPPNVLLDQFHVIVEPMEVAKHNFQCRLSTLQETRDLLLPRLISGELDVSELNITVPEEAA